ncbi:hypothetical protein [Rhodococcus sp. T7]|uniref:hypothetical protein n=1 Tax=Rhodococcus sp. T7 TaxID=627444 RepID=UPI00135C87D6|nr:hypothetical protein [Rhodococcus sp. T7]KAF0957342.1 hypothetical protein MLGJGCBP_09173 [Rhodococcus sp. T7]KAF0966738.1 hypothetical protein MLGJGCBP_00112 [Rhodococcus sp. T7]
MAAFIKQANTYFVALYPQSGGSGRINFYCADDYRLYVIFTEDAASSTNTFNAGTKTGVAYADIVHFPYYIDLARNEKPVNVTFNPDATPPRFVIHSNEPIGEGEM